MKPVLALLSSVALVLTFGAGSAMAASGAGEDPSAAGAGYTSADAPLGAPVELSVDLRGRVAPRCEMVSRPVLSADFNLNYRGDVQSGFGIDCNAPFNVRVRSGQGGFASVDTTLNVAPLVPYEMSLDVGTDGGVRSLGWCKSEQLADNGAAGCAYGAGSGWSSGGETAINRRGLLRLRWKGQGETELPAFGRYRDTIVIELEVRS